MDMTFQLGCAECAPKPTTELSNEQFASRMRRRRGEAERTEEPAEDRLAQERQETIDRTVAWLLEKAREGKSPDQLVMLLGAYARCSDVSAERYPLTMVVTIRWLDPKYGRCAATIPYSAFAHGAL